MGEEKLGELHWPFIFGKYPNGVSAPCLRKGCVTAIFLIMWEATSKKAAVWFHPSGNLSICESLQDSWISKLHGRGQPGLLFYFGSERMFHIYQWHSKVLYQSPNHCYIILRGLKNWWQDNFATNSFEGNSNERNSNFFLFFTIELFHRCLRKEFVVNFVHATLKDHLEVMCIFKNNV